jgi:hypothetical protein
MKTATLKLPEDVNERDFKMAVAAILFDKAIFSSGQAADFVGISKRDFIESNWKIWGICFRGKCRRPESSL